ncbi:MAG: hypothetical protein ACK52I_06120 [Pseudomonadota bacterium]
MAGAGGHRPVDRGCHRLAVLRVHLRQAILDAGFVGRVTRTSRPAEGVTGGGHLPA